MSKVVESLIFRAAGVTNYKKAVRQACKAIAEDSGIPEYSKFYGDRTPKEIEEDIEYGGRIFKYEGLSVTDIELITEPNNKYDKSAIKIIIYDNFVGYVPSKIAKQIHKYFSDDIYLISAVADIVGGPYKEWDDYEEKVITDNSLDVGFEIYLSIIDSSQEERIQLESHEIINDITDTETIKISEITELAIDKNHEESIDNTEAIESVLDKNDKENINTTEITESVTDKNHEESIDNTEAIESVLDKNDKENINTTEITESVTDKNHEENTKNSLYTIATESIMDERSELTEKTLFTKIIYATLYIFLVLFGIVGIPIAPFLAIPLIAWSCYKLYKLIKK